MFILPDTINSALKEIEKTLSTVVIEKSFEPLKKYITRGQASLIKKRKFAITINALTRLLQKNLSKQTISVIRCQVKLNSPCDKKTLKFYARTLIPAWQKMLAGNILPLCNIVFLLQSTPALLSLTSPLLLFTSKDKINTNKLHNIKLEQVQFYIDQLLNGDILIETLEDSII